MERIEKTVFLSYRRTNIPWALAIFQNLTQYGYDVFFDYNGISSGDFEQVILGNITARAHFLVLLTPSALERCQDPEDWLRREIVTALETRRNIVPLMLEGFDFGSPGIVNQLTDSLAALKNYNGLRIPQDYFDEAMVRLRSRYLNAPLNSVLHPASANAQQAAVEQKAAATAAPAVQETELTAQQWFERGLSATDPDEKIRNYSEAVRIYPDYAEAFRNRGIVRHSLRDLEGALADYNDAIRLKADDFHAYHNRGVIRDKMGDRAGAQQDYEKAIRLKLDLARPVLKRGIELRRRGDFVAALREFNEAIRLNPEFAEAYFNRGKARLEQGDKDRALNDFWEALRFKPDYTDVFYTRANIYEELSLLKYAISDYQKYLDLGGGVNNDNQAKIERRIRELQQEL
jgi:tetratricopeptide (TPR) repeat protein